MKFTAATLLAISALAIAEPIKRDAEAEAAIMKAKGTFYTCGPWGTACGKRDAAPEPAIMKATGKWYACGPWGTACGKRDLEHMVRARNLADIDRVEDFFNAVEKRDAEAEASPEPAIMKAKGKFYTCGPWGTACGKRDLEYLGIYQRDAKACGAPGFPCSKREVLEKVSARNAERLAHASEVLARDPAIMKAKGTFYACGPYGTACGKRDFEELDVVTAEHEGQEIAEE